MFKDDSRLHLRLDPELKGWLRVRAAKRTRELKRKVYMADIVKEELAKLRQAELAAVEDAEQA